MPGASLEGRGALCVIKNDYVTAHGAAGSIRLLHSTLPRSAFSGRFVSLDIPAMSLCLARHSPLCSIGLENPRNPRFLICVAVHGGTAAIEIPFGFCRG